MRKLFIILLAASFLAGCSKKQAVVALPAKADLVFPAQDAVCTQGTILSATESSVTFKWNQAANASSYDLTYTNLLTLQTQTQNTSTNSLSATLSANTPYSWYVVSKQTSSANTAQSDTWKFYNAGQAVSNYAPYPAALNYPQRYQTIQPANIGFIWHGTDPDGDPLTFDLYCSTSTNATPKLVKSDIADTTYFFNITVGTYYWKVVSKDNHGNSSSSETFVFTAKQ